MAWMMVIQKSTAALKRLFDRVVRGLAGRSANSMLHFDLVWPQLFVGTAPRNAIDVRRLREGLGVTAVLNLQTEEDFTHWRIDWPALQATYCEHRIAVDHVPIRDFDAQSLISNLPQAVEHLSQLLDVGHRVYLHCTAGQQRSPATAIAYLVRKHDYTLNAAIEEISSRRVCAPDIEALTTLLESPDDGAGAAKTPTGMT